MIPILIGCSSKDQEWVKGSGKFELVHSLQKNFHGQEVEFHCNVIDDLAPLPQTGKEMDPLIDGARVAILLISRESLTSSFMNSDVVARIWSRAQTNQLLLSVLHIGTLDEKLLPSWFKFPGGKLRRIQRPKVICADHTSPHDIDAWNNVCDAVAREVKSALLHVRPNIVGMPEPEPRLHQLDPPFVVGVHGDFVDMRSAPAPCSSSPPTDNLRSPKEKSMFFRASVQLPQDVAGSKLATLRPAVADKTADSSAVIDKVEFSAFAPDLIQPGSDFILEIWAYLTQQRAEALERARRGGKKGEVGSKGPIRIERGDDLTIWVHISGLQIDRNTDVIAWDGEISNTSFLVNVPKNLRNSRHTGRAKVICKGVEVTELLFEIEVGSRKAKTAELQVKRRNVKSIFASYSSEDRLEALRWARTATSLGIDVFVDVLALREGDDWEKRLWEEVPRRDLFWLFWSKSASESSWVEKEWRCALAKRGCRYIQPIPLVDPRVIRPPDDLANCAHFEDVARIVLDYEQAFRNQSMPDAPTP